MYYKLFVVRPNPTPVYLQRYLHDTAVLILHVRAKRRQSGEVQVRGVGLAYAAGQLADPAQRSVRVVTQRLPQTSRDVLDGIIPRGNRSDLSIVDDEAGLPAPSAPRRTMMCWGERLQPTM